MSPVENTGRLVWMTRAQLETIAYLAETVRTDVAVPLHQVVAAFDAAPSDPVEAAEKALEKWFERFNVATLGAQDTLARAVLVALGANEPAERPQWCPCCHDYHAKPIGEKQDNGTLVRECPRNPYPQKPSGRSTGNP